MIAFGLFLSTVGINPMDSYPRFTFGSETLMLGIDFLPIAMGLFGVSEILNIAIEKYVKPEVNKIRLKDLYPSKGKSGAPFIRRCGVRYWVFSWGWCRDPAR